MQLPLCDELLPLCEQALRLLDTMAESTATIDTSADNYSDHKHEVVRLTQLFRCTRCDVLTFQALCRTRPVQARFFWHTYASQLRTAFLNVDNAWLTLERMLPKDIIRPFSERIRSVQQGLSTTNKPGANDPLFSAKYTEMIEKARLFRDYGTDTSDAASFLASTKETALTTNLAKDDADWLRQMLMIAQSRDELCELIASAKSAAGKDVSNDEILLAALIEHDEDPSPEVSAKFLGEANTDCTKLRQKLASEQIILTTICATIRVLQPKTQKNVALVLPQNTPTYSARGLSGDETRGVSNVGNSCSVTLQIRLEADRSDPDAARHEPGSRSQNGTFTDSKHDRFIAQKRLYDEDFDAQRNAKLRFDALRIHSSPQLVVDSEASAATVPDDEVKRRHLAGTTGLVAVFSIQPCDNSKRAVAASKIAEMCGLEDGVNERDRRNAIRREGGIRALVAMLHVHCKQAELDEFCRALLALACYNEDNRTCMIEEGLIPILISRVSDQVCHNRQLTPLWKIIDLESPSVYTKGLIQSWEAVIDSLLVIIRTSFNAEELLLASRALLFLLHADDAEKSRHSRILASAQDSLTALSDVLVRRFGLPEDDEGVAIAGAAKAVAAEALLYLILPLAHRMRGDLLTIEGASKTILSFYCVDDDCDSDKNRAICALIRYLFDHLATVAESATSPLLTAAAIKGIGAQLVKSTESALTESEMSSLFIQEQAARTLRILVSRSKSVASLNRMEISEIISHDGVIVPLVDLLRRESDGPTRSVIRAKQEGALLLKILAEANRSNIVAMVSRGVIPALVRLIDATNKDEPKEAAVTALWVICKESRQHRNMIVNSPRGIKILMHLIAKTATNAADEASCRLLYCIAKDDVVNEQFMRMQQDVLGDMLRTLEWNSQYGATLHVKGSAKLLRDKLKANSVPASSMSASADGPKKLKVFGFCGRRRKTVQRNRQQK